MYLYEINYTYVDEYIYNLKMREKINKNYHNIKN